MADVAPVRPVGLPEPEAERRLDGGFRLVVACAVIAFALLALTALRASTATPRAAPERSSSGAGQGAIPVSSPAATVLGVGDASRFLASAPSPAPDLRLTTADDQPFDLARDRGAPTFVFFGYTHCPDVCPATVGTIGQTMEAFGRPAHAVFVTVDPERDTTASLRDYRRYLEQGFEALTGSPTEIAAAAAGWGVRYAKVETGVPGEYSMSHTADVWLLDARGIIRARFPFGTSAGEMIATLRMVDAPRPAGSPTTASDPPATAAATSADPGGVLGQALGVSVISSSIWAGAPGPVILDLTIGGNRIDDPALAPVVQLESTSGIASGEPITARAVQPPGESRVVYVATVAIPTTGWWRLDISIERGGFRFRGSADVSVLDPGTTAAIGAAAPSVRTPTLADVGGQAKAITTDPAPDLRLSQTSTADALGAHQPFVLVIDSWKFKVTSACGRALVMARYLVDRWPGVAFVHLEPLRYDVVTDTPVLVGSLAAPTLTDPAAAWGLAGDPWGPRSMPWVFVVDANGIVRSKSEGVMGSDDVDVILAMLRADG